MTQIVRKKKNINIFFWAYIISLCIVITYTLIVHSTHGFSQGHANLAMRPFYNDHTSYGAALAMFIPIVAGFIVNKENKKSYRVISGFVFTYLIIAIIFSYTRAAWVSLLVSFALWLMLKLKINYKIVLTTVIILIGTFFAFQEQILLKLEGNKQDSSTDFSEHIRSITNVATDASNMERINRWNSAVRMYKEKPVFGWGPGTYQFNYAPFQYSYEKTIISTNAGNMGNAHSEYLGALSESGFLGMISFVLILIYVFITSVKVYNKATSKSLKILIASIICGLITYYAHGFLNNFLDIDKIAVPFLGFIAIIVAADVYFKDFDTQNINNEKKI
jgi:O-antigen ligase